MSPALPALAVRGVGVWTPRFPDLPSLCAGAPLDPPRAEAPAPLIPPKQRRRATTLARMAATALAEACTAAAIDVASLPTVFASMLGEVEAAAELITSMAQASPLSPTRFQNSVHNTASGLLSIATGQTGFTTSIAAGRDLAAMGLLEALALACSLGAPVALVLEEERWPPSLSELPPFEPACVALVVEPARDASLPRLARLSHGDPHSDPPLAELAALHASLLDSPVAPALDLARALAGSSATARVLLEPGARELAWGVDVVPAEGTR